MCSHTHSGIKFSVGWRNRKRTVPVASKYKVAQPDKLHER